MNTDMDMRERFHQKITRESLCMDKKNDNLEEESSWVGVCLSIVKHNKKKQSSAKQIINPSGVLKKCKAHFHGHELCM